MRMIVNCFFDVFHCNRTVKIGYALDNESTIAVKCVIQLLLNVLIPPGDFSGCL